jgi:hypothetical protein
VKSLRKSSSEQGEKLQGLAVMGELDDKMANFLSTRSALTAPGDFEIYKSFNSISKISYVRNSKLFFRHSSTRKYNRCGSSNIYTSIRPFNTTASQAPIAQRILKNHLLDLW